MVYRRVFGFYFNEFLRRLHKPKYLPMFCSLAVINMAAARDCDISGNSVMSSTDG